MKKLSTITWNGLINILSLFAMIPFVLILFLEHLKEETQIKFHILEDKLFMKRFGFVDDDHFEDFIKWNCKYIKERELKDV